MIRFSYLIKKIPNLNKNKNKTSLKTHHTVTKKLKMTELTYTEYIQSNKDKPFHIKCRHPPVYQRGGIRRVDIPDDKVRWKISFPDYKPEIFTAPSVLKDNTGKKPPWADYDLEDLKKKARERPIWNAIDSLHDNQIDRKSYECEYELENLQGAELPKNPKGRTGLKGRGALGRWGPNHAADPVVTRWKPNTRQKVLEFISIQRRDTGEWAIPGGMVDPGEHVSATLKREFSEESMGTLEVNNTESEMILKNVDKLFRKGGERVYRGYVDDPRNTDNAWMETDVYNFHDEDGSSVANFKLHAGDDATGVKWMPITKDINLYASHADFVHQVAKRRRVAEFQN